MTAAEALGLPPAERAVLYRGVGCDACEYQGYRGRATIMEILRIDAGLDELIARRANAAEILAAARTRGFTTLAEDGARLTRRGVTSVEELIRVVDLTDRMG